MLWTSWNRGLSAWVFIGVLLHKHLVSYKLLKCIELRLNGTEESDFLARTFYLMNKEMCVCVATMLCAFTINTLQPYANVYANYDEFELMRCEVGGGKDQMDGKHI